MRRDSTSLRILDSAAGCSNCRGQIIIQIKQMLLQIVQRSSLGHVIRILVEIPEPHFFVLPVSESNRCHRRRFYRYCFSGSMPGRDKRWALRGKRAGAELRSPPPRHRPLVECAPGLREADIALTEIANKKLTFESTFGENGDAASVEVVEFPKVIVAKKAVTKKKAA